MRVYAPDGLAGTRTRSVDRWNLNKIHVSYPHSNGINGSGKTIAIIDSGLDFSHPHFKNTQIVYSINYVRFRPNAKDDHGHGTHVAGVVVDCAPGARLLIAKVLNRYNSGNSEHVTLAINWAIDRGADVINLSLGTAQPTFPSEWEAPIRRAVDNNVLIVAASGNTGDIRPFWPATHADVLSVGATDRADNMVAFTNTNSVELVAPGKDIVSARANSNTYISMSGTSMAAPHVSGLATLFGSKQDMLIGSVETSAGWLRADCKTLGHYIYNPII